MQLSKSIAKVEEHEGVYTVSIYTDELTDKTISTCLAKIAMAFPDLPATWYNVFMEMIKTAGYTNQRLIDAVNHVILTCEYPKPTIAKIISYDKQLKLYTYYEMVKLVGEFGEKVWSLYKVVNLPSRAKMWACISEAEALNMMSIFEID